MDNIILNHTFSYAEGYIEVVLNNNHMYITHSIEGSSDETVLEDSCGEQVDRETLHEWGFLPKDKAETAKEKYAEKIGIAAYDRHFS